MNQLKHFMILASAGAAMAMAGCSDDAMLGGTEGQGKISLAVDVNSGVLSSRESRAEGDPIVVTAADLSLTLTSTDGSYTESWDSPAEFPTEAVFPVGYYNLEAYYGSEDTEGFDVPYYYGSAEVRVRENATTEVGIVASLANSMFSIAYTDAVKNYLTSYSAELKSAGSAAPVIYEAEETRAAYMKAGEVEIWVNVTKPNGKTGTLKAATVTAEAKHHYFVTVDLNGGEVGDAQLIVSFDETLSQEDVEIDLSDELMNAPAPEVTAAGFTSGEAIQSLSGFGIDGDLDFNIIARGGLKEVKLVTTGAQFINGEWPAEIDLIGASASVQANLESLGLKTTGLWRNPDKMAIVRLAGVVANASLPAGINEGLLKFELTVVDQYGKTNTEAAALVINLESEQINLASTGLLAADCNAYTLYLEYNGPNPAENVLIQAKNDRGTWDKLPIVDVQETTARAMKAYLVTVTVDGTSDYIFRAINKSGTVQSAAEVEVERFDPGYRVADTFATRAYYLPEGEEGTVYISADNGLTYTQATTEKEGSYVKITGLTAGTTYLAKVKLPSLSEDCPIPSFTTEAAAQLPNSGMEDWCQTSSGTYWELIYPGVDENSSVWGTNNPMTTSQGASYAYCRISGTISTTDSRSGNAALIRTVGWGSGNTAVSTDGSKGVTKYIDAGLLHLGSSRTTRPADHPDRTGSLATSDLDCGLAFESRPEALTFWYKYTAKNSADQGLALVQVLDASDNVLSAEEKNLPAAGAYTKVTLPLSYTVAGHKAAKIYVKFLSTNSEDFLTKTKDNLSGPGFANLSRGTFMGSQLYIDDIELVY